MKHLLFMTAAVLTLAACGERSKPEAAFDKASQPATSTSAGACSPLPAGVVVPVANQLRSDVFYVNKNGVVRRRVVLQVLEGDHAAIIADITHAMTAAGFQLLDKRNALVQRVHLRFRKGGYGIAHLFFDPISASGSPVQAVVTFDLPPPSFNPPRVAKRPPTP
jgi:hypothetical protein